MSWKIVPTLICDGCGTVIDTDYFLAIEPTVQAVLQRDTTTPAERDFCCEACEAWWKAEYPQSGPWGPAWEEREWWRHHVLPGQHVPVRTAHEEMPLAENRSYFDDPEQIK